MISSSISEFILATISAGCPASARRRSRSISFRNRRAQARRRHRQLLQPRRIGIAGQRAEERGRVFGDRLRAGHEPEVGVDPRGPLVVVAGAEVDVAPQALRRPPDDQADLRVGLVAANAVDDVRAGFLERARPLDVALLVESRRQLDEHGDLLVALGGALQAGDDRRADAGAVQRLLDREDVGIVGRLLDQRDDRIVGVVGMVQQDVALVERP